MVDVLDSEVHGTRSDGFAEAVVGVVVVLREDGLPALDEAGRDRLRADVHQTPLVELVVLQLDVAAVDGVQDVLRPRHEQPDDRAVFLGDRADDPFGLDAAQEHGLAADQEAAEPVHLRAGVVQRRDAEERVFAGLPVVLLLHDAGVHEAAVTVHDGLRESGGAGGEVDRGVLVVGERDRRGLAGAVGQAILPIVIPALETAARVLSWVGDVVQGVMDGPFGGLVSVIGTAAAAFALAVPAFVAISGAINLIKLSAIPAAIALWEMVAPLLPFIIIGAAVAYAIYEIGKAFGWWTDVSSMLDAVWAGVQRLWSAFINHPDVQGFISAMIPVWNWLQYTIASVIKWVQSFFQNSSGEKFDFVRALIDTVGLAWKAMTLPIRLVITVVKLVLKAIQNWYLTTLARVNMVKELFRRLPGQIRGAISSLVSIITKPFTDAYNRIKGTVGSIKSTISGITHVNIGSLTSKLTQPVTNAYNNIAKTVSNIINKIKSIPHNIPGIGGAFGFDYEGMLEELNKSKSANVYTSGNESLTLDHNINFKFDFTNLPPGTSEETLVSMLQSAITDRSVINQLVNSPDFQNMDQKVKNKITLKNGRARGV